VVRDIKFRLWDGEDMLDHEELERKDSDEWCVYNYITDIKEDECLRVMQYTGLKDKSGKEIYEGDIIEGGYMNLLTQEFNSKKFIVEYKEGCFGGKLIGHSPYGDTWLKFIKGEVIGNIYENPELLEG
jgi:uncharacterized phage protein (TIGR01671 family)